MLKTLNDILTQMAANFVALGTAWIAYRNVGRDMTELENKLVTLYALYCSFPYLEDTQEDINRAQLVINITIL